MRISVNCFEIFLFYFLQRENRIIFSEALSNSNLTVIIECQWDLFNRQTSGFGNSIDDHRRDE